MRTVVLGALFLLGSSLLGISQVSSSASSAISSERPFQVCIGTFVFEQGEKLAVELVRREPCPCLCGPISILGFRVVDPDGDPVYVDSGAYPVPIDKWVGEWCLVDGSGNMVPPGDYTLRIDSSAGEFRVMVQVVTPGARPLGKSFAQASVCGLGVRVYRLITEEDEGSIVALGEGAYLMVALPGNPTTGYSWAAETVPNFLEPVAGVGYLPEAQDPVLVGGGGIFFFRFRAKEAGSGTLSFAYKRAWETAPPAKTFTITVEVG